MSIDSVWINTLLRQYGLQEVFFGKFLGVQFASENESVFGEETRETRLLNARFRG